MGSIQNWKEDWLSVCEVIESKFAQGNNHNICNPINMSAYKKEIQSVVTIDDLSNVFIGTLDELLLRSNQACVVCVEVSSIDGCNYCPICAFINRFELDVMMYTSGRLN